MKNFKYLIGFVTGMRLGMWLRGVWLCLALCICNPSDDAPLWVVALLVGNVVAAGLAVYRDRERWKVVSNRLNEM